MSERRLSELRPNPNNPRKQIRDEGFPELVASIRVQGVLQPLLITEDGLILAGHRRYEAAKEAGLETVPIHIFTAIEGEDYELISLVENLLRSDLKPLEVGRYLISFRERYDMTVPEISGVTGISAVTIYKYLKLMKGPSEIREMLAEDKIALGTAMELTRHEPEFIAKVIKQPNLTKQEVRNFAATGTLKKEPSYQEARRRDISIALELLEELNSRLEPYGVNPQVTFGGVIKTIEGHLTEAGVCVGKLENHLVDWAMLLAKQSRKQEDLGPVETRDASSLLNDAARV